MKLREYFAARHDPYAGGDLENARRLAAYLWLLGTALTVGLLPFSPPTDEVGDAGWVLAWLLVAVAFGVAYALHRRWLGSWEALLIPAYASVLGVCVMQWLSGGVEAPYQAAAPVAGRLRRRDPASAADRPLPRFHRARPRGALRL